MATCGTAKSTSLPPLYASWIEDLLGGATPQETIATCSDCAMVQRAGENKDEQQVFFKPELKCCTYSPNLANFLVGNILRDGSPEIAEGRASVERRLDAKVAVTPLAINKPSNYTLQYEHSEAGFGRSRALLCPHYINDGGRCGIWRYRNGVCSTWFCKHDRGAADFRFWRGALESLLGGIERELARWCVLELGYCGTALERLLDLKEDYSIAEGQLEGTVKPSEYREMWGKWNGKERQFYEGCSERVESLSWTDVVRICGPQVRLLARRTQDVYAELAQTAPAPALRCGSFKVVSMRNDIARLSTYLSYDPIDIPIRLLAALQHFEGQPTAEAIAVVAARENVNLDSDLVRKLTDFAVLVPAKDEDVAGGGDDAQAVSDE